MKKALILVTPLLTLSCSTIPYEDLDNGPDFYDPNKALGYQFQKVAPNYYRITYKAKVIWALSSFDDSWLAWNAKAQELCGNPSFIRRNEQESMGTELPPGWLQTVSAYADCTGSAESEMIAKEKQEEQKQRDKYNLLAQKTPCKVKVSSENIDDIYIWAHGFYKYELYKNSMACFNKVLEYAPDNEESMVHIAKMYEAGKGVSVDKEKAKYWYSKAEEN